MNAPEAFELFLVPEGQKKLTISKDTKTPNTATFIIQKEDHTLGNLLCATVQKNSGVILAGYKVPHPLDHSFQLRIQTKKDVKPVDVLANAIETCIHDFGVIEDNFKIELAKLGYGDDRNAAMAIGVGSNASSHMSQRSLF